KSHLAGGTTHLVAEYRVRHADGSYRWMLSRGIAVRDETTGKPYRFAGSQTDVDERKKMEEQLMHLALHDPLTDLPNRTLFFDRLAQSFSRARKRRKDESLAIIFVDIDRFKNINDSLGHLIGDLVLQQVAGRFRACIERVFGSLGEDEGAGPVCSGTPTPPCTGPRPTAARAARSSTRRCWRGRRSSCVSRRISTWPWSAKSSTSSTSRSSNWRPTGSGGSRPCCAGGIPREG